MKITATNMKLIRCKDNDRTMFFEARKWFSNFSEQIKIDTLCHHVDFNSVSIAENGYFSRDIYSVQLEKIIGLS